jgi:type I restriction enzyme R subunit
LAWIEASQADSWQRLVRSHGTAAGECIAERARKNLNERGTLEVLRRGVEILGLKSEVTQTNRSAP